MRVRCEDQSARCTERYRELYAQHPEYLDMSYNNFVLLSVEGEKGVIHCLRYVQTDL